MIRPSGELPVYLYTGVTDMRKAADGLSALVELQMEHSPFDAAMFVFCNRRKDRIKILVWERNGFVVWFKRLEKQTFKWPDEKEVKPFTIEELNLLLDGYDVSRMKPHKNLHYQSVS